MILTSTHNFSNSKIVENITKYHKYSQFFKDKIIENITKIIKNVPLNLKFYSE